jgi:hypothetical protein
VESLIAFVVAAAGAAVVLVPGLDGPGIWSQGELPVLDRALAALGEPRSELVRSPWLPDELRMHSLAAAGVDRPELGLRLPGALAAALVVGLAGALGRWRGGTRAHAVLAALFALGFPGLAVAGRTALGNPVGEATAALAIVLGAVALARVGTLLRVAATLAALGALGLSIASTGIVLGAVLPLIAIALSPGTGAVGRWIRVGLWVAALGAGGTALWLALGQGEGFIPLLGASKDLELLSNPHEHGLADALEDLAWQTFPWLPLAIVGGLAPGKDRWPGAWLVAGLAIGSAWAPVYGRVPLLLSVPIAVCCAVGTVHLFDPRQTRAARRLGLVVTLAGLFIAGKDVQREPHRAGSPLVHFPAGLGYPDARLHTGEILHGGTRLGALVLVVAFAVSRRSKPAGRVRRPTRLQRLGDRLPIAVRRGLPLSLAGGLLAAQAIHYARIHIGRASDQLSAKAPLARHADWVSRGLVPPGLGTHRIRDPGVAFYGPAAGRTVPIASRSELMSWLFGEQPAVALVRRSDLPPLHAKGRQNATPLRVLDESHHDLVLVANWLPAELEDRNPLPRVVLDTPPELRHPTLVQFERYVEVIAWEIREPVIRGRRSTLRLVLRPLRPLPAGAQLYARLQRGKMSRINATPHDFVGGIYPPNEWRAGDYILHEFEFDVPLVEILSGPHEFIVGVRRGEHKNLSITVPEGAEGDHGVVVRGDKREFAVLGQVMVY